MARHIPILHMTEDYMVFAKPSGVAVHRSQLVRDRTALVQIMRRRSGRYVYPVHRLDRAVSGCLIFAFNKEWATRMQQALKAPSAKKTYLAFVRGACRQTEPLTVTNPVKTEHGYKEALSEIRSIGFSDSPRCSLLMVQPKTGRNHQVRRHVRDIHHPVIGDRQHGDSKVNRYWRDEWGLPRLGLHCISLDIPIDEEERLQVVCPVPPDLKRVWEQMPWWNDALAAFPALSLRFPKRPRGGSGSSEQPTPEHSDTMTRSPVQKGESSVGPD